MDLGGDAQSDRCDRALQALQDQSVDCGLVLLTPQAMVDLKKVAETIASVGPRSGKTLLASILGLTDITPAVDVLESNNIPHYTFPESAVRALAAMAEYSSISIPTRTSQKPMMRFSRMSRPVFLTQGSVGFCSRNTLQGALRRLSEFTETPSLDHY